MRPREFKNEVFVQFARIAAGFASPKRIEIIDVLVQGERNVETLAAETGLTVANASRHLQVLKTAGLVTSRKEGVQAIYRTPSPAVLDGYRALRRLAEERLADVGRLVGEYFGDADGVEPITRKELIRRTRRGEVTIVDVRPDEEFAAGHIAGARSFPLNSLERLLSEVSNKKEVIAYCRGPYCVLAAEAVRMLRRKGYSARRLEEGYPEWRDAGLPVEPGSAASRWAQRNAQERSQ